MSIVRANTGIVPTASHPAPGNVAEAKQIARGLRKLARFIELNPELVPLFRYPFAGTNVPARNRETVVGAARAGARMGGVKVDKHQDDHWAGVDLVFSDVVSMHVYIEREAICERIVVGNHEVTEELPDAEALAAVPKVTVTRTVEDVEWRCVPLLAEEDVA